MEDDFDTMNLSAEELIKLYYGSVNSESGEIPEDETHKAFAYLITAADKGLPEAWAELGACYFAGIGVDQDEASALDYLEKAALRNVANAQMNLYSLMWGKAQTDEEKKNALYWLNQAAANKVPSALYEMGNHYYHGMAFEQDYKKAVEYFTLSAEAECSEAMAMLGVMYQQGQGVEKNPEKSVEWFVDAAEAGSLTGLCNLGCAYMGGLGVKQDYEEAKNCFLGLTDLEDPFIEMPDLNNVKTRSDIAQVYLQNQAYIITYPLAHHNLGIMYQHGLGDEADEKKALYHFMLAAENDYAPSCLQAGAILYAGDAMGKPEPEKAFDYLTTALNAGIPEAKLFLGMMYYGGEGVAQDKEKGIAYLDELIAAGNVQAIQIKNNLLS